LFRIKVRVWVRVRIRVRVRVNQFQTHGWDAGGREVDFSHYHTRNRPLFKRVRVKG
jgi:hypothetical protein